MIKKYFVANWKMNPKTFKETESLMKSYREAVKPLDAKRTKVVVAPPFLFLRGLLKKNQSEKISFAGQNCFWRPEGAFTGEISPAMLRQLGAEYVILGHSERRKFMGESDEMINGKLKAALKERLKVILCLGETDSPEQNSKGYFELKKGLQEGLKDIKASNLGDIIVAYEPVWAISTNPGARPDSPDNALSSILYLRKLLGEMYSRPLALKTKILYGGSVNSKNIKDYFCQEAVDGVLAGGASLNGSEAIKMLEHISEC